MSMVEFPGIILQSFLPTLQAMQRISKTLQLPYDHIIAPKQSYPQEDASTITLPAPRYAQAPGFRFNLSCILESGESMHFAPDEDTRNAAHSLAGRSRLDRGQAAAIIDALSHSFSCIQGPPGTGKSYTGVALIRTLLANRFATNAGPIIIVTFTNHALDQVLERLFENGVDNIIRVGSRSKSDVLQNCKLREVVKNLDPTPTEKAAKGAAYTELKKECALINELLEAIASVGSESSMKDYLLQQHPQQHDLIFKDPVDEDGFRSQHRRGRGFLKNWCEGGHDRHTRPRPLTQLQDANVLEMSKIERQSLLNSWCTDLKDELNGQLCFCLVAYNQQKKILDDIRAELDLRVLQQANIIGLTTSGLARQLDLLQRVDSKILICEEAGEVIEAHMLTALLPSIEHTILIGDHQQLRPHVQNYELSSESRGGQQYALDLSLFERLVKPTDDFGPKVSCCTLEVQRRMHPSVSRLVQETQYPDLTNGPNVYDYPQVVGMRKRLFWMTHNKLEDKAEDPALSTSQSNAFEADMVAALVKHIVQQGVYSSTDCVVLTPYLGQLRAIRRKLEHSFAIVLNEMDEADLEHEKSDQETHFTDTCPIAAKSNLLGAIRLATVDNFQGEEAKVVIVSLVRSNAQGKPGFLATPNRINVLLSRAQHGMYIIGNASTTEGVPMWRDVLDILRSEGNFGNALELACPRHLEKAIAVQKPEDFLRLAPESGCDLLCDKQLDCGHSCVAKCHSEMLHSVVYCLKPCTRVKKGCNHVCPKVCGDTSCRTEKCSVTITDLHVELDCGHTKTELPCYQHQDESQIVCQEPVEWILSGCGHRTSQPCFVDVDTNEFSCSEMCGELLVCGHVCHQSCSKCHTRENGSIVLTNHDGNCKQVCGRPYSTCKHSCAEPCHPDWPCQPCTQQCDNSCAHSACGKSCSKACRPCLEQICASGQDCPHSEPCRMPCAAPCDWIPCSRRCEKPLSCGCQCPSVCGEVCPKAEYCQKCATNDVKSMQVDLIMFKEYKHIDLDTDPCVFLPCGHIFTIESLDGVMGMSAHYTQCASTGAWTGLKGAAEPFPSVGDVQLKTCPECRGSLRSIARYGRVVRRALLDESTKRLVVWSNHMHETLATSVQSIHSVLLDSLERFRKRAEALNLVGKIQAQISTIRGLNNRKRYTKLFKTIEEVKRFLKDVEHNQQPYNQVHNLLEYAYRTSLRAESGGRPRYNPQEIQPREHLQAENLLLRCYVILLSDVVSVHKQAVHVNGNTMLVLDLADYRLTCEKIYSEAQLSSSITQQVESMILWARFAALECSSSDYDPDTASHLERLNRQGMRMLDTARDTCKAQTKSKRTEMSVGFPEPSITDSPSAWVNMIEEIDEVKRMLRDGVATSEMQMIVTTMAKEFRGTGHWYRCANGHPFSVGECGMPMELARCPECGAAVGGEDHRATGGVTHARDIDDQFGRLRV